MYMCEHEGGLLVGSLTNVGGGERGIPRDAHTPYMPLMGPILLHIPPRSPPTFPFHRGWHQRAPRLPPLIPASLSRLRFIPSPHISQQAHTECIRVLDRRDGAEVEQGTRPKKRSPPMGLACLHLCGASLHQQPHRTPHAA